MIVHFRRKFTGSPYSIAAVLLLVAMLLAVLASVLPGEAQNRFTGGVTDNSCNSCGGIGLSNPAAAYCMEMGYQYRVEETPDGQCGICILPDGTECDEWSFYRGECGASFSYCAKQGWPMATIRNSDVFSPVCTTCIMPDGSPRTVSDLLNLSDRCIKGSVTVTDATPEEGVGSDEILSSLPDHFDWRNKDGQDWTTSVKDQGNCGSCWAFSAVGIVESAYDIALSDPDLNIDLSEEYLVSDCFVNNTCCGGWHYAALSFIKQYGISDEACFPYVDGTSCTCSAGCDANCSYSTPGQCSDATCSDRCSDWSSRLQSIDDMGKVAASVEDIKAQLVEKGPLSVAMGIGDTCGGYWDGEIYKCTIDSKQNHAVIIVGYDETNEYWIVKNSWGVDWPDPDSAGYFKVGFGECAIQNSVYYASIYQEQSATPTPATTPTPAPTPTPTPTPTPMSTPTPTPTPAPPPPAPSLKSPSSGATVPSLTPRLEWYASTGASDYGLQVATDSSFTSLLVNQTGITDLYFDIPGGLLNWNSRYYWRVNASNSSGSTSNWSRSRYFRTAVGPPPNAPSDLIATTVSSSRIDLTWHDNSDNEAGFKIERRTGTGSYSQIATTGVNVTSYSSLSLAASTTYFYRVRAYSAAGNSDYSNEASDTTLPPPPPVPSLNSPSGGATVPSLTPRLEWYASTGASDYGLQVATDSSFTSLLVNQTGITDLYFDIPGGLLNWNSRYYWRVNASNSSGSTSNWSRSRYFRTAVGPPPGAPSDLIATTVSSSRIDLTWHDNSDNEAGFKIERRTATGSYSQIATTGVNVTSYSSLSLAASTTYFYRVRAYSAAGNSDYSNEASDTTLPPPPPRPTLKSPSSGATVPTLTPRLEWYASTGASDYGLQVATDSSFTSLLVNQTGITDLYFDIPGGLLNWNSRYYWRVNACNSYGSTSNWSRSRYFRTAVGPPPNAPSDLVATTVSSSRIDLTWHDNSDNETGFKIERRTGTGSYSQIATLGANVSAYSSTSLAASTTYYYRVRAYSAAGNSDYSNEASDTTLPPPPPVPSLNSPSSGATVPTLTPRLEWYASTGASDYGLQVATDSTFTNLLVDQTGITDLYFDMPGGLLNWNTRYYWRVNASNSSGSASNFSSYRYFSTALGQLKFAVIVGISNYQYINDLNYCDDDARDIYNRLIAEGWQASNITLLIDSQAGKANIQAAISWMAASAGSDDLSLFFFSGHGTNGADISPFDEADGYDEYLCPYDMASLDGGIRDDELDGWMSTIAGKKVVMIDSCFSGGFVKTDQGVVKTRAGTPNVTLIDSFARDINKAGFVVLTACDDDELSWEYSALQNGVFSYYIEKGLSGLADINSDGVSAEEDYIYTNPLVQSYTGNSQNPQLWDSITGEVVLTSP